MRKNILHSVIYIEIMYSPFGLEFAFVSPCIGSFPANKKTRKLLCFFYFISFLLQDEIQEVKL